ncbi:hypothetical protein MJD09_23440 [bacterium]|nr:hypothetical protein [bacterium]
MSREFESQNGTSGRAIEPHNIGGRTLTKSLDWTTNQERGVGSCSSIHRLFKVAVHPDDPNAVIAVGVDIWKSTDGGATLTQKSDWSAWFFGRTIPGEPEGPANYSHGDHRGIFYHPENSDIVYFATDGGIFRSLDAGETFEGYNGGY